MEVSQTNTYYFNNLTFVHQTENELYIMGRETTLVLNFQQTSYQTLDQIIHALRLVRDKKIQDRKSIIEQEMLALNFQLAQESSNRSSNGNGSSNGSSKTARKTVS
jgi:hypothetical protein